MGISILGICFLLLLLAVCLFIIYNYKIKFTRKLLTAFINMAVSIAVLGVLLTYIFKINNTTVNIIFTILLTVTSAFYCIKKARLKVREFIIPVSIGMFLPAFILGILFLLFVVGTNKLFSAQYFIPIIGLLVANMSVVNYKALHTYYMGLKHHNALYYYLVGNGATHNEAVRYFVKRALEKTLSIGILGMTITGALVPTLMWSVLITGVSVVAAVMYQVAIVVMTLCAAILSIIFILWSVHSYSFDKYDRLNRT